MANFKLSVITLLFSCFLFSCNKKNSNNSPDDVMTAQVGTTSFESHGDAVHGLIDVNPVDESKTELSVTAESGSSVLTVAVYDFTETAGTFTFATATSALGAYSSGSGDDPIVSGTLTLTTVNSNLIEGTFSGVTQGGTTISNGSFSLHR